MFFINHYSILLSGVIALGLGAFFLFRRGLDAKRVLIFLLIAAVLTAGWIIIRPQQASADNKDQFEAELKAGRNVLLELQSPF